MRRLALPVLALLAGCSANGARVEPTAEESRLIAYLSRDPYVVIDSLDRDADGNLVVVTQQGDLQRRYLIAADDPARPDLRLRPLLDSSTLDTAPNEQPGGGPIPR
ncbi:MAG TPA: hypothetical protein DCS97_11605 [Planctomycetes bacterium]|nr:hypothetical protein [Planctomycetota bacterium]